MLFRSEAKRAKRQHYRELNEPPKLTVLEEVGNAVTHGTVSYTHLTYENPVWVELDRGVIPENEIIDEMVKVAPQYEACLLYTSP